MAYRALDNEREAFPLTWLTDQLLMIGNSSFGSTQDMVNWLIASSALIPYSGGRISFVHQSITEYCAALELVRLSEAGEFSLRDTVALKWDQCLFLALGMMPKSKAEEILDFLTHTDLALAFSAVRYAEDGQSAAITTLLAILVERGPDVAEMRFGLFSMPFGTEHAPYLEQLLNYGGSLAGDAVQALATIRGPSIKPFLIELLDREKKDFNFSANGIARALKPLVDRSDLPRLFDIAVGAASMHDDENGYWAIGDVLARFDPDLLIAAARAHSGSPMPPNLIILLCRALQEREDKRSFEILADLVLESHGEAITALYFRLPRDQDNSAKLVADLGLEHVKAIWRGRFSAQFWDGALHRLCRLRPEFADEVRSICDRTEGIERVALLFCLDSDLSIIRKELERLNSQPDAELARQPFGIFSLADLDWAETASLYPRLLIRDIEQLRSSLLGDGLPCDIKGLGPFRTRRPHSPCSDGGCVKE